MRKDIPLYEQIAPEYKQLSHKIQFYHGLKETGQRTTASALKAGFMLIKKANTYGERAGIFIQEKDKEKLLELITQISQLRQQSHSTTSSSNGNKKRKPKPSPQKKAAQEVTLQEDDASSTRESDISTAELESDTDYQTLEVILQRFDSSAWTEDERELIDGLQRDSSEQDNWTETRFNKVLEQHRKNVAGFAKKAGPLKPFLCLCSWCRTEQNKRHKHLKKVRKQNRKKLKERISHLVDPLEFAQGNLGEDLFTLAKEEILKNYFRHSIHDTSTTSKLDDTDEALLEKLQHNFASKLKAYRKKLRKILRRKENIAELKAYHENEFQAFWEQKEEELRKLYHTEIPEGLHSTEYSDLLESLEKTFQRYRQESSEFIASFQGHEDLNWAKRWLRNLVSACQKNIESQANVLKQRLTLHIMYEERSDFASYFTAARKLNRTIKFFCGPTNSGKTYAALNELAAGESGVYLAPLRLMAMEGQDELQRRGVKASYITGEERSEVEGAKFIASTIEMLDYHKVVDTAIIDEVQLISDKQRGWAWTNALVGVPAETVILTGSPNAVPLVRAIVESLGETLEIWHYARFNPLIPMKTACRVDDRSLEPGCAIICFSRRGVLELKRQIEANTRYKVSVIYGGLSPDVRRDEARRFRQKQTDILVATDAISMGLNLPIKTVIFWTTVKKFGGTTQELTYAEIKQIAGRAGRYGIEDRGYVGAFYEDDLERIREALPDPLEDLQPPCSVMPMLFHVEMLSEVLQSQHLGNILRYFQGELWFSKDLFTPLVTKEMQQLADTLEEIIPDAPLDVKYTFACAPVDTRSKDVITTFLHFVEDYKFQREVILPRKLIKSYQGRTARDELELRNAEDNVKVLTIYRWLSYRFPQFFCETEKADGYKYILNNYISRSLDKGTFRRTCQSCGKELPFRFRHRRCDDCHFGRKGSYWS